MQRRPLLLALAGIATLPALRAGHAQSAAWTSMFNGRDLEGWDRLGDANWRIEDGAIAADRGNGFLVSRASYGDFAMRFEVYAETHTNSGVFIRATDPATITSANAYEVNIWDERPEPRYGTGAIVDVAAVDPMPKAGGRWNTMEITAKGDSFTVVLNGQTTVNGARDAKHARGRIALQHGAGVRDAAGVANDRGVIRFRKLEIQAL